GAWYRWDWWAHARLRAERREAAAGSDRDAHAVLARVHQHAFATGRRAAGNPAQRRQRPPRRPAGTGRNAAGSAARRGSQWPCACTRDRRCRMTTETPPNIGERWVEELELALQRFGRGAELLWDQSDAPVGQTPRELVGRKGKARLYLYRAQAEQVE